LPGQNTIDQQYQNLNDSAKSDFTIQDSSQTDSPDTLFKVKIEKGFTFTDNDSLVAIENFSKNNTTALFKEHALQPTGTNPKPIDKFIPDWFIIILFATIGIFTWLKLKNNKIIQQLFAAFFNNSVTNQIVRDENISVQRTSVTMSLIFYLTGALFLYEVSIFFNWEYRIIGKGIVRFIIFVLFLSSAYSFKMVFLKMLSTIFQIDRTVSSYIFNIFLINNIVGVLLIPFVLLIAFFPLNTVFFIWIALGLLLASFIYRLFRGIIIWMNISRFSLYYLILYLCALEIAPLLIIFKLA
jgi:hypothetical protein